ncbi:MAG: carbon starvation protein A [Eggerthellaceae bacterium]|nr:carbon starvation protein A [Eggerthellaceae bacterium]
MTTFLIGLALLVAGGAVYGRVCERVMKPTDDPTPATVQSDGVDFVPMKKWRNSLIELLNIAGTGPILGPIQGALFGPVAFITIPVGCVIAGAFHDYMVGMISIRNRGGQVPELVRLFLGRGVYYVYAVFVCLLLLLIGVVFVYTPGDIFVNQVLHQESTLANPVLWGVYAAIFGYYVVAALFPIDKIIGRVYPVFGAILLVSAVGVFAGLFLNGYPLPELWDADPGNTLAGDFVPIFFVTVTCGILSGFHSTQATIVSRTVVDEREGRTTFYDMMVAEGFIAMTWAAAYAVAGLLAAAYVALVTSAVRKAGGRGTD